VIYLRKDIDKILLDHSIWVLSKGRSGKLADLKGINLDGTNLEMANLPFAQMQSTSLNAAYLQGANFRNANLNKIKLNGSKLDGADFEGADLGEADLGFINCTGANFSGANLRGSSFVGAKLVEINFRGANLRDVNFKNAKLSFADLRDANLENANFEGSDLFEVDFEGTQLKGVDLDKARYQKSDLGGAIFSGPISEEIKLNEKKLADFDLNNFFKRAGTEQRIQKEDLAVDANIINQDMVAGAFRELVDKVKSNINEDQIKAVCKARQGIDSIEGINFEKGDVVTHNGQVAIKLDFKISYTLSLLIDRWGNCTVPSSETTINP
jgi:uncharacterized protein YjbI with pentapeptide repeats